MQNNTLDLQDTLFSARTFTKTLVRKLIIEIIFLDIVLRQTGNCSHKPPLRNKMT